MSYSYDRSAGVLAANPPPVFKAVNLVMGRAKKVYADYLTQKTGVPWEAMGSFYDISHMLHRWYAQIPGQTNLRGITLAMHVGTDYKVPGYTVRFVLDWGRDQNYSQIVQGLEAEDFKSPAFLIPQDIMKDIQYALSGSTAKEADQIGVMIQNNLKGGRELITRTEAAIAELAPWGEGSTADIIARIKKNRSAFLKAFGALSSSGYSKDVEKVLNTVIGEPASRWLDQLDPSPHRLPEPLGLRGHLLRVPLAVHIPEEGHALRRLQRQPLAGLIVHVEVQARVFPHQQAVLFVPRHREAQGRFDHPGTPLVAHRPQVQRFKIRVVAHVGLCGGGAGNRTPVQQYLRCPSFTYLVRLTLGTGCLGSARP